MCHTLKHIPYIVPYTLYRTVYCIVGTWYLRLLNKYNTHDLKHVQAHLEKTQTRVVIIICNDMYTYYVILFAVRQVCR